MAVKMAEMTVVMMAVLMVGMMAQM